MFVPLLCCAFVAFYLFVKKRNNYWKERGVVTVDTNLFFGISLPFLSGRQTLEEIHDEIYEARPNEPYVGVYMALRPVLFLRDPALIRQITVKDFGYFHERVVREPFASGRLRHHMGMLRGEEYKTTRTKFATCFSSGKIKNMSDMVQEYADQLVELHLRPNAKAGKPVDIKELITRFALDCMGKCLLDMEFNSLKESKSLFREAAEMFRESNNWKTTLELFFQMAYPKLLLLFYLKSFISSDKREEFFFDLLHTLEKQRNKKPGQRDDLFQLMLDIKNRDGSIDKYPFTDDHIASNIFAFYSAAHQTPAFTLTFALHELAKHPEVQEKLRQEIRKASANKDDALEDYEILRNIDYLEMVLSETLRLHGPNSFNDRMCMKTYRVPNSTFEIRAGERIFYSVSGIHKDEKYFPNPLKFDPERFSKENMARMDPNAFLPFGDGPKKCMGMQFAKMEMKICLAYIISHFKLTCCDITKQDIVLNHSGLFHSPENDVWLSVEEI